MSRYNGDEGRVYVGDLPRDASEREIERVFREYGSVRSVWVARNPPGFAFVMFEDERDAEDAVKALDGSTICGVRARVKHSSDRPSGRPRPPMRRHFDPNDRCYRCNQRGHYAYDCDKYAGGGEGGGGKSRRSYSRSRSRSYEKRKSYSRSPSQSRNRGRSFSRSRSRSK